MSDDGRYHGPFPGQQTKYIERTEHEVFGGGAGGGGKSLNGMGKFGQQLAVERGRFQRGEIRESMAWGMYFRRTMPDLAQAIDKSHQFFKDVDPNAEYNVNDHRWTIPSCGNAKFQFGHMETENSKYKYKSAAWTYVFFDELTEFTETMYDYIDTRIRTTDPVLQNMLQLYSASNPDGPGLLWVRRRFIENKEPEVVYRKVVTLRDGRKKNYDSVFIPFKLEDNPVLFAAGNYEASLLTKRPEVRRAILDGDWWINPGAFFTESWDKSVHVVPNHEVPRNARIWRSLDPGLSAPSSCTWWYEKDNNLTGIHNLYVKGHDASMLAGRIREIEQHYGWWDEEGNRSTLTGPMDEDAFSRNLSGGPSYARVMNECGIRWVRSKKDRFNGIAEMLRRMNLRSKPLHPGDPMIPGIRWMERCKAPIETIPMLQTDPNDVDDVDTKGEDHCLQGDTEILTSTGRHRIRDLVGKEGALISTDGLWHPFVNVRKTATLAETVVVRLVNGEEFCCTPDHRVLNHLGEWINAGDLDDTCYAFIPWSHGSSLGRSRSSTARGTTSAGSTFSARESVCTSPSGLDITEFLREVTMSITRTKIARTIGAQISNASRRLSTWLSMGDSTERGESSAWTQQGKRPGHGTAARPGENFTVGWLSRPGSLDDRGRSNASDAGRDFDPSEWRDIAPRLARLRREEEAGWTTRNVFALPAGVNSWRAGSRVPRPVHGHAVRVSAVIPADNHDVYCLTVPMMGAFALAAGPVVSNCFDETRYMCMFRRLGKESQMTDDDDDDNIVEMDSYRKRANGTIGTPPGGW